MQSKHPRCFTSVDLIKNCIYCDKICVKNGKSYEKQRYLYKSCKRSFVEIYTYNGCKKDISTKIKEDVVSEVLADY